MVVGRSAEPSADARREVASVEFGQAGRAGLFMHRRKMFANVVDGGIHFTRYFFIGVPKEPERDRVLFGSRELGVVHHALQRFVEMAVGRLEAIMASGAIDHPSAYGAGSVPHMGGRMSYGRAVGGDS